MGGKAAAANAGVGFGGWKRSLMNFPKRLELPLRRVLAFPNA